MSFFVPFKRKIYTCQNNKIEHCCYACYHFPIKHVHLLGRIGHRRTIQLLIARVSQSIPTTPRIQLTVICRKTQFNFPIVYK